MNEQEKAFINLCYLAQLVQKEEENFRVGLNYYPKLGVTSSLTNEEQSFRHHLFLTTDMEEALNTFVNWMNIEGILLPDDWDNVEEGGQVISRYYKEGEGICLFLDGSFSCINNKGADVKDFFDE